MLPFAFLYFIVISGKDIIIEAIYKPECVNFGQFIPRLEYILSIIIKEHMTSMSFWSMTCSAPVSKPKNYMEKDGAEGKSFEWRFWTESKQAVRNRGSWKVSAKLWVVRENGQLRCGKKKKRSKVWFIKQYMTPFWWSIFNKLLWGLHIYTLYIFRDFLPYIIL